MTLRLAGHLHVFDVTKSFCEVVAVLWRIWTLKWQVLYGVIKPHSGSQNVGFFASCTTQTKNCSVGMF